VARSDDTEQRRSPGRIIVDQALRDKQTLFRKLILGEVIGERVRPMPMAPPAPAAEPRED